MEKPEKSADDDERTAAGEGHFRNLREFEGGLRWQRVRGSEAMELMLACEITEETVERRED